MPAKKKTIKTVAKKTTKKAEKAEVAKRIVRTENRNIFYFATAIILGFGIFLCIPALSSSDKTTTQEVSSDVIAFDGVEGKTALDLLKQYHTVETTTSSYGDFVTTIDGQAANSSQFWAFYVNGEMATEGAGTYVTKSGDRIVFKLSNIE